MKFLRQFPVAKTYMCDFFSLQIIQLCIWCTMQYPGVPVYPGYRVVWHHLASARGKSCQIIWCIDQREYIVEKHCDLLGFKCFQRLLSTVCNLHRIRAFWTCYCAFCKDTLNFLNPNTAPKIKINQWTKWWILTWYPGVQFMSSYAQQHQNSAENNSTVTYMYSSTAVL